MWREYEFRVEGLRFTDYGTIRELPKSRIIEWIIDKPDFKVRWTTTGRCVFYLYCLKKKKP